MWEEVATQLRRLGQHCCMFVASPGLKAALNATLSVQGTSKLCAMHLSLL